MISFPTLKKSDLVEKYLRGEFGNKVNPYAVSMMFALDRYLNLDLINHDSTIICDRYTTSNLIYRPSEISNWIEELEYNLLGIPEPDKVIFLDMPPEYSMRLIDERGQKKDIHECDTEYQKQVYKKCFVCSFN